MGGTILVGDNQLLTCLGLATPEVSMPGAKLVEFRRKPQGKTSVVSQLLIWLYVAMNSNGNILPNGEWIEIPPI